MTVSVLVLSSHTEKLATLQNSLAGSALQITLQPGDVARLHSRVMALQPDMLVLDIKQLDGEAIQQLKQLNQSHPLPVVLFTRDQSELHMEQAIEAGVSAYICDELSEKRLKPILQTALLRFRKMRATLDQLEQAKVKLEERKLIEKAKGILMKQRGCSEDEAYSALRSMAMKNNKRIAAIAESLIAAAELLA